MILPMVGEKWRTLNLQHAKYGNLHDRASQEVNYNDCIS